MKKEGVPGCRAPYSKGPHFRDVCVRQGVGNGVNDGKRSLPSDIHKFIMNRDLRNRFFDGCRVCG
ncbi:MAG: hypothetical protein CME63_08355 [Halobacteriovoraceae bacterium]|nr:hypothetical protein [Halobacteriovoraceae bacterium]